MTAFGVMLGDIAHNVVASATQGQRVVLPPDDLDYAMWEYIFGETPQAQSWFCCIGGASEETAIKVSVTKPQWTASFVASGINCDGTGTIGCDFYFTANFTGTGTANLGNKWVTGPFGTSFTACDPLGTYGKVTATCSAMGVQPGPYEGTVILWQECASSGRSIEVTTYENVAASVPTH